MHRRTARQYTTFPTKQNASVLQMNTCFLVSVVVFLFSWSLLFSFSFFWLSRLHSHNTPSFAEVLNPLIFMLKAFDKRCFKSLDDHFCVFDAFVETLFHFHISGDQEMVIFQRTWAARRHTGRQKQGSGDKVVMHSGKVTYGQSWVLINLMSKTVTGRPVISSWVDLIRCISVYIFLFKRQNLH